MCTHLGKCEQARIAADSSLAKDEKAAYKQCLTVKLTK